MSGYTIGEIVIWLLLASVLGFTLGWIGRELLLRAKQRSAGAPVVRPLLQTAEPAEPAPPAETPAAKKAPAKKTAAKKAAAKKATPPRKVDDT